MLPKRVTLCILLLLICCFYSVAQNGKGTIYRKISDNRLAGVLVNNLRNGTTALSDAFGNFSINVNTKDTLQFSMKDYALQKQVFAGYSMVIYMQPEIKLDEITIKGQTKKKELNEVINGYRNKGLYFDGKPPLIIFNPINGSPLTGFHELFGKDAANERRFAKFIKKDLEAGEVDRRYNKQVVMRVTSLKDTIEALKFIDHWRPSFTDLKTWSDYELIKNIKAKYEGYRKLSE